MKRMSVSQLRHNYETMSNADLCRKLGISVVTLLRLLDKYDIPHKGKGKRSYLHQIIIED